MKRSLFFILQAVLAATLVISVAGCGGSGGSGGSSTSKPRVRVVNASPDSNPIQMTIGAGTDLTTLETGLSYLNTGSVFHEEKANTYDIEVSDSVTSDSLWAETFAIDSNKDYLFLTYGLENFGSETFKRLRTAEFSVDLTAPVGNKANLVIFHAFNRGAGFDTPSIDFQNPGDNPQFSSLNIGYGQSQNIQVDSGSALSFEVRRNGTEQVYATSTPTLDAGGVYLVVVSGVEGSASPQDPKITYIKLN